MDDCGTNVAPWRKVFPARPGDMSGVTKLAQVRRGFCAGRHCVADPGVTKWSHSDQELAAKINNEDQGNLQGPHACSRLAISGLGR